MSEFKQVTCAVDCGSQCFERIRAIVKRAGDSRRIDDEIDGPFDVDRIGNIGLQKRTVITIDHLVRGGRDQIVDDHQLAGLTESMAVEVRQMLKDLGIKAQVKGYGSLQQIHFTPEPVSTASTAFLTQDRDILRLFNMAMMNQGLFIGNRGFFALSTVMEDSETERALEATERVLTGLKPVIEEAAPQLAN